jgi:hypothetical protein
MALLLKSSLTVQVQNASLVLLIVFLFVWRLSRLIEFIFRILELFLHERSNVSFCSFPFVDSHQDLIKTDKLNPSLSHLLELVFSFKEANGFKHFLELLQGDTKTLGSPEIDEGKKMEKEVIIDSGV